MTNRSRLGLVVVTLVGVLQGGCGDDAGGSGSPGEPGDEEPPPFNGLDPTVACPAGQVGWDFSTGGGRVDAGPTTGKVCIPTVCTGKSQRDANMKCVANSAMPEVVLPATKMNDGRFWLEPSSSDYKQSWIRKAETNGQRTDYRDTVEVYPGVWGAWKPMAMCSPGYFVNGYRLRVEGNQGGGDDTALNAVELSCATEKGAAQVISSHQGAWGGWLGWNYCPGGKFATGGAMRFEDPDGDDTASNDMYLHCGEDRTQLHGPGGSGWGNWKSAVSCGKGRVACGVQVRFEDPVSGDDTAMNGMKFACCDAPGIGANANNSTRPLFQEVPYKYAVTLNTEGPAFKARLALWVTRRMIDRRTQNGAVVAGALPPAEAYACTLTYLDAEKLTAGAGQALAKSRDIGELISPECIQGVKDAPMNFERRAKAKLPQLEREVKAGTRPRADLDAAVAAINNLQHYIPDNSVILHVSFDPMGDVYVPSATAATTLLRFSTGGSAPNPPGFYYYPDLKWVDMLGFYQQREISVPWLGPSGETTGLQTSLLHDAAASAFDVPTKLLLSIKDFALGSSALKLNPFEPSPPPVTLDIDWAAYGDVDANPYSTRKTAVKISGVTSVSQRNLRATVEFRPSDTSLAWRSIGEVKLPADAPVPTGSVKSGTFFPSKPNTRDLFRQSAGAWKSASLFDLRVCLDADGLNARAETPALRLPTVQAGNYQFSAGYESADKGCVIKTKALTITRDTLYRPLPPQRTTGDVGMADTTKSGGEDASGSTDNGGEKICADTATGRRCDSTSSSGMGGKGFFGRNFYESTSYSSKTDNKNGSGSASTKSEVEMMGFQVIDLDDAEQTQSWATDAEVPPSGYTLTIAPNWDLLIEGLKKANPPGPPPKPRFDGKTVKGRMGLGIGVGFEATVHIGPIPGRLIASFGLGFSVALKLKIGFVPQTPYPCTGNSNDKCFAASTDRKSQPEALKACAGQGARLAEIRGVRDRDGIMAAAGGSQHYWIGGQLAYQYADLNCADPTAGLDMEACKRDSQTSYRWMGTDREIARSGGVAGAVDYMNHSQIPARPPGGLSFVSAVPTAAGLAYHGGFQRIVTIPQSAALPYVCEFDGVGKTKYTDMSLGLELAIGVGLSIGFYIPNEHFGFGIEGYVDFITVSLTPTVGYREFTLYDNAGTWLGTRGATYTEGPWEVNLLSCGVNAVANFLLFSAKWSLLAYPGFTVAKGKLWDVTWSTRQSSAMRPEPAVEAVQPDTVIPADQRVVLIEGETVGTEHGVGRVSEDGWVANPAQDGPGYLVSGPARSDVPAGLRAATFRLKIDNNQGGDHVARLEVVEVPANRMLASRDLYRSDFYAANTYVDFMVPFTMPNNGSSAQFRVYWTDRATVDVDRITAKARRADLRNDVTIDEGQWGDWQGMRYCPDDSYITGYHMRVEGNQGGGDDTALNSVEFQCTDKKGAKTNLSAHPGLWGGWNAWNYCPNNGFIKAGQLKIEGNQGGGDDTGANSLRVQCTTGTDLQEAAGGGAWGNWRNLVSCPVGEVACGAEVRIERDQGGGDDTAMNGLRFACCANTAVSAGVSPEGRDLAVDTSAAGTWAPTGKQSATCATGTGVVGLSKTTTDTRAHRVMCGASVGTFTGTQAAMLSLPNDQRRAQRNGDWAANNYKLECGLNEYVSGIAQGTEASTGLVGIRCASGGGSNRNCEYRSLVNGVGYSGAYNDWDPGHYKADCPAGKTAVGVAAVPGTNKASGLLCCEP